MLSTRPTARVTLLMRWTPKYPLLAKEVKRLEPQMLLDGNDDTLRLLLDVVLANDEEQGIQDYAAY